MVTSNDTDRVCLAPNLSVQWDDAQRAHMLHSPNGTAQLNDSAAIILGLCDGSRNADEILRELDRRDGRHPRAEDVQEFLGVAREHGWIVNA